MMESFLIDLFVRSLGVLALVGGMVFAVRRFSAAVRSLVWRVGIGLLLALPAMVALLPKWTLAWLPATQETVRSAIRYHSGESVAYAHPVGVPMADPFSWIVGVYAIGVVIGLVRLAASFGAASIITRRGVVVERTRDYRIVLSKEAPMPFAFGLFPPSIVLPATALDWEAAVRDDVVAHEAAHVTRQDWLWLLLGRIAAVLYWPNVGVAWMLHRARMDAEMAADDQVVAGGQDQIRYAEHLVRVARACQTTALLAPMAAEPPLTTRLRSLLSGDVRRNSPGRPAVHAAFVMGMLLIGPFAATGFGPRATPPLESPAVLSLVVEETLQPATAAEGETVLIPPGQWVEVPPQGWARLRSDEGVPTEREERTERQTSITIVRQRGRVAPRAPHPTPVPRPDPTPEAAGTPVAPTPPPSEPAEEVLVPVEPADSEPAVTLGEEAAAEPVQVEGSVGEQTRASRFGQRILPPRG
jgi:beta-lactamase regulating signal transducer with metallopeptidase domain